MQIRLNAEIVLSLPENNELTDEERDGVILWMEQRLNRLGGGLHILENSVQVVRVGVLVHILEENKCDVLYNTEKSKKWFHRLWKWFTMPMSDNYRR